MQRRALGRGEVDAENRLLATGTVERLDDHAVEPVPGVLERRRLAQPPGGNRRQPQRLAEQLARELGQVAEQRARFEHAGAERIGEHHRAAARAVGEPGDSERGVGPQLERVAVVVVLAAQQRVDALQALYRLQPDLAVAYREVAPLDEREAEVARQQRVLEVRLVVRSRRQQADQRRAVAPGRPLTQRITQGVEERGEVLHVQVAEHLREHARDDEPVLQRIARARGRLRAVVDDPPAAVRRTRQVGRVVKQVHPTRRPDTLHLVEKAAVAEHHRRRDRAAAQQILRAVDVLEHAVEQLGALRDAGLDLGPLGGCDQERQRVDFPRPVGALGVGIHVVGDAVLADLALHQRQRVAHVRPFARGEPLHERAPVRARLARRSEHLVEAVFGDCVVLQQGLRHDCNNGRVRGSVSQARHDRASPPAQHLRPPLWRAAGRA